MPIVYENKNRGYQQLRVWEDAIEFYVRIRRIYKKFPFELKRVVSQQVASADSIRRNIAEGYCRRSVREYIHSLCISLGSMGESVSGLIACQRAGQLGDADFVALNDLAFKLENGLLKLIEALERKEKTGDWIDHLAIEESHGTYIATPSLHDLTPPLSS